MLLKGDEGYKVQKLELVRRMIGAHNGNGLNKSFNSPSLKVYCIMSDKVRLEHSSYKGIGQLDHVLCNSTRS